LRLSGLEKDILEPMDSDLILAELLDLAGKLGIEIRRELLGGDGGGLCLLRGRKVLFVDTAAALIDQVETTAAALSDVDGVAECYVRPEVRQLLDGG
jgi:hypothetical protein